MAPKTNKTERSEIKCNWCRDEESAVRSKGLCDRCYYLQRKLAQAKSRMQETGQSYDKFKYETAMRQVELAQWEGEQYGDIENRQIDGMRLETEFRFLSKRLLGKDLFFGYSNIFDWEFNEKQRRVIFGCSAKMMRRYLKNNRLRIAQNTHWIAENWQSEI